MLLARGISSYLPRVPSFFKVYLAIYCYMQDSITGKLGSAERTKVTRRATDIVVVAFHRLAPY
jgi:hypothetical protein